jgi:3',5'-cyclic AMP phosphodiesterase CpdA
MTAIQPNTSTAVRLAHFSDIHITAQRLGWRWRDWLSKRSPGWVNLRLLGRRYRFRQADMVLATLMEEFRQRRPDHLIFSGDATALGFEAELARVAALLRVGGLDAFPGMAVPGNHDYYTRAVAGSGLFERYFAPWQKGLRVDASSYPFAQRVGPVWLVGVNSSQGNLWFWDASGRVGTDQLKRLETLLGRLEPGPRILVTHYPVCLASGEPEHRHHNLRDLADLLKVAERGGVCLWLHGHRHDSYHHASAQGAPFPIVCSGSATQSGRWSYGEYTIIGGRLQAVRRVFSPQEGSFQDGEQFDLQLSSGP